MDIMETMVEPKTEVTVMGWHPSFLEDLTRLCKAFSDEALNEYNLGVEDHKMMEMIEVCKHISFFLVVDGRAVGVIAGMQVNNLTNGKPSLQEVVWYVDKEYRSHGKKLLDALEDLGKAMKVSSIVMGLMCNSMQDRLDKFYRRLGYKPFEVQYIKEIS
jgi:GNAT superfamily N-acetyltransferase